MNKRFFSILAGMCLCLVPGVALAQMVGVIMPAADVPYYVAIQKELEADLAKQGLAVDMLVQRPAPNEMAWKNSTRKLMTLEAKAIVAYAAGTALAAMSETHDLPIVFCGVFDSAGVGLAGGNIAGVEAKVPLKVLVTHLRKMTNFTKLGVLFSSDEVDSVQQVEAVAGLGVSIVKIDAVMGASSIAFPRDIQAVLLTSAGVVQNVKAIAGIVEKARAAKIATASVLGGCAEHGILISLAASTRQQAHEAARMVSGVLQGALPSSLPVVRGNKVELTVNLIEANALGLNVPFEVIATAKVIK